MFYLDALQMDKTLRFGDIIRGFPICYSVIDAPSNESPFNISVLAPTNAVVLSPCCSIEDKVLAIAPLKRLENKIFANPYLADDPTRINIPIAAEKSVPPQQWDKMDSERKANMVEQGEIYVFLDKFVYAPHDLFDEYPIHRKEAQFKTRCYVVDFRDSIKISCERINRVYAPGEAKVLQLSAETRDLMRRKIGHFYQRRPAEDAALLAS
ncbi:MAG: hypothetical protein ACP5SH_22060 [Syntrophobacteraceae bacterium]